ncbi:hypothetical protein CVT26_008956 [Gymnopilus dilepis]|uniref:REJ domain-containing protein n=1 Tax=Gymnopilus dilepis TaxID=231916 RepID=A0A409YRR7_9AGAR|nr:hypothetical protein CVT26_008956 [Gymnopilus dilepis]
MSTSTSASSDSSFSQSSVSTSASASESSPTTSESSATTAEFSSTTSSESSATATSESSTIISSDSFSAISTSSTAPTTTGISSSSSFASMSSVSSSSSSSPTDSAVSATESTSASATDSSVSSSSSSAATSSSSSSTSMSSSSSDASLSSSTTSSSSASTSSSSSSSSTSDSSSSSSSSASSSPSSDSSSSTSQPTTSPPTTSPPTTTPPSTSPPTSSSPSPTPPDSSSALPSSTSQDPPARPVSTSTPLAASTFSSTVFVPTTDSHGSSTSTAPPFITSTAVSTDPDGVVTTVTKVIANPTLSPNDNSSRNAFFRNTGAVAGVFVLVGLAGASVILWIIFAVRRRRRTRRLEYDTAVNATLAAAGFHRTPLDDDDDPAAGSHSTRSRYASLEPDPFAGGGGHRSSSNLAMSSIPSAGRTSAYLDRTPDDEYNPYTDYIVPAGSRDGYVSGTPAPPSGYVTGPLRDRRSSTGMGMAEVGAGALGQTHHHHNSSGSYEPLLASYYASANAQGGNTTPPSDNPFAGGVSAGPSQPDAAATRYPPASNGSGKAEGSSQPTRPDEPLVQIDSASSVYSDDDKEDQRDDRLDPGMSRRLDYDAASTRDPKDEEDYSRPVLGVRNLPDSVSLLSTRDDEEGRS